MLNLRSLILFLLTVVWTALGMTVAMLEPTGRLFMWFGRTWGRQVLWLGNIDLKVVGAEKIDWSKPYVIICNHASQVDIPALFCGLPTPIRFMAKRSLFFIPFFGWSLYLGKFIPVDRGRSKKARESVERGARRIRKGPSLMVFPEGTRSADGEMHPFKSGAFVMGLKAQVPILPVAIRGTYDLLPKHRVDVQSGSAQIVIGDPIPTEGLSLSDREALKKRAFTAVSSMFETGKPYSEAGASVES